jgi:hypothetical protein
MPNDEAEKTCINSKLYTFYSKLYTFPHHLYTLFNKPLHQGLLKRGFSPQNVR